VEAVRSALKALIVNKISDIAFYGAIIMIFVNINFITFIGFNTLSITPRGDEFYSYEFIILLLVIAAFGKSAQLGLHV
jgi:NADH:ubiquinone oxidoreductase subunit 5 (subunit L)/multisubunit Na+/H+ antiporter MnhA subunit